MEAAAQIPLQQLELLLLQLLRPPGALAPPRPVLLVLLQAPSPRSWARALQTRRVLLVLRQPWQ
jgi:hypothetical protein